MKKIGKNSRDIQKSNRVSVLRILLKEDVVTRTDIARITGLKQATITNIVNDLLAAEVVSETGTIKGNLGRRSIGIRLNTEKFNVIGIKIARRSYSVGVFDIKNQLLQKVHEDLEPGIHAADVLENIISDTRGLLDQYRDCCAIGVAVPGPYLRREGRIAVMSEFVGWERIDICKKLSEAFEQPVYVEHDANAGALSEWKCSSNIGSNDVLVHLLASEGIGSGVVIDGKIIGGYRGIFGEVGHMSIHADGARCVCGNYGCLEMYSSALSFAKRVIAELPDHPDSSLHQESSITADTIFRHMRDGDEFAISAVEEVGHYLGYGIANIVNLYDPKEIVISDIMTGGGETMLAAIKETAGKRLLPEVYRDLIIRYSEVMDLILSGAAAVAIDRILEQIDVFYGTAAAD